MAARKGPRAPVSRAGQGAGLYARLDQSFARVTDLDSEQRAKKHWRRFAAVKAQLGAAR
jgi:hypothetical protein